MRGYRGKASQGTAVPEQCLERGFVGTGAKPDRALVGGVGKGDVHGKPQLASHVTHGPLYLSERHAMHTSVRSSSFLHHAGVL